MAIERIDRVGGEVMLDRVRRRELLHERLEHRDPVLGGRVG